MTRIWVPPWCGTLWSSFPCNLFQGPNPYLLTSRQEAETHSPHVIFPIFQGPLTQNYVLLCPLSPNRGHGKQSLASMCLVWTLVTDCSETSGSETQELSVCLSDVWAVLTSSSLPGESGSCFWLCHSARDNEPCLAKTWRWEVGT